MNQPGLIPVTVVLVAAFVAAFTDVWKFRVHNLLTLPLITSGIFFQTWMQGWDGFTNSLLGLVFGFGILFIFFVMGGMGAGDVKLMAGIGAWLGLPLTFWVFATAGLVCGAYAIFLILVYGRFRDTWSRLRLILYRFAALGRQLGGEANIEAEVQRDTRHQRLIPFAAMIAFGLTLLLTVVFAKNFLAGF